MNRPAIDRRVWFILAIWHTRDTSTWPRVCTDDYELGCSLSRSKKTCILFSPRVRAEALCSMKSIMSRIGEKAECPTVSWVSKKWLKYR